MVEDRYTLLIWGKANRPRGGTVKAAFAHLISPLAPQNTLNL